MSHWGNIISLKCYEIYYLFFESENKFFIFPFYGSSINLSQIKGIDLFKVSISNNITSLILEKKVRILSFSSCRIGPHNLDILSIIYGGLLGDAHGEKRQGGNGTRITFQQESIHNSYAFWLHSKISELGYCSSKIPQIQTRLGKNGVVRKFVRFRTWTYTSFNFIHNEFYLYQKDQLVKRVPKTISIYLTPLALAIWIMDDGSKVGKGLKFATNSFSYQDCLLLSKVLFDKYGLKTSIHSTGYENQNNIYIWKQSMCTLREIVSPYIIPSMKYKILDK
jgi:ubiquinol-cytochrome c reductase cytochrome b subunit